MPRKKNRKTPIKVGDFVFAKVNGYRAWPGRVLEVNQRYNVFFYGTCNTTKVYRNQIFTYVKCKKSLGNLMKPIVGRKSLFRVAMRDVELAYNDPTNDIEYFKLLKVVQDLSFPNGLVSGMLSDFSSDSKEEEDGSETEEDQSETDLESNSMIAEIGD